MDRHAVFYALVTEHDEDGTLVDYVYYGGETPSKDEADAMAYALTNDRALPGSVLTKIYRLDNLITLNDAVRLANKHFNKIANEMYEVEDMLERQRGRRS